MPGSPAQAAQVSAGAGISLASGYNDVLRMCNHTQRDEMEFNLPYIGSDFKKNAGNVLRSTGASYSITVINGRCAAITGRTSRSIDSRTNKTSGANGRNRRIVVGRAGTTEGPVFWDKAVVPMMHGRARSSAPASTRAHRQIRIYFRQRTVERGTPSSSYGGGGPHLCAEVNGVCGDAARGCTTPRSQKHEQSGGRCHWVSQSGDRQMRSLG